MKFMELYVCLHGSGFERVLCVYSGCERVWMIRVSMCGLLGVCCCVNMSVTDTW